jgi:hypothetical protein
MTVSGDGNSGGPGDDPLSTYETELTALHDSIGQVVQVLLTDSVNVVKQTLMEHSVTRLAPFFGRTKGELAANKHPKEHTYQMYFFFETLFLHEKKVTKSKNRKKR